MFFLSVVGVMKSQKEVLSAWVTKPEKELWKNLAAAHGMTPSAYTNYVIHEILNMADRKREHQETFQSKRESTDDPKVSVIFRLTQSELSAVEQVASAREQSKQEVVITAVREFLLRKPQVDEKSRTMIIDSTLAVNKIGINLNQIARVLNAQNKSGQIDWKSVEETLSVVRKVDEKVLMHIKAIEDFLNKHYRRLKLENNSK